MTNSNVFTTTLKSIVFKQITTLLLAFTLIFGFYTEGSSQCACTDCRCTDSLELVKLYNATDGLNWMNKWDLSRPMTTWYEVVLTNNRVSQLVLISNKLKGALPNWNLPYLQKLVLNSNQLNGRIPNLNLPNLQYLDMASNQLIGKIPSLNLPNLQYLDLQFNQLSGCILKSIRTQCPLITANRGNVSNNPNLETQNWANYWNSNEGACWLVAVTDTQENNGRLYPNPAHDFLFLEGFEKASKILIYNVLGSLVLSKNANDKGMDISHLSNGIYTVRIISGEKSATRLFMKN